jgi:hypothetical protein
MPNGQRFQYLEIDPSLGPASTLPYLPLRLEYQQKDTTVSALIDSGSMVNVLPYNIGLQLGAEWDRQAIRVQLTGNLAGFDARAILITATMGQFAPVRLAFAWTRNDQVPVILGQVNFFMEYDVCFFRSQSSFEITPKALNKH